MSLYILNNHKYKGHVRVYSQTTQKPLNIQASWNPSAEFGTDHEWL